MKKIPRAGIVATVLVVLALSAGTYLILNRRGSGPEKAGQENVQLWTCGMHPEVILDHPGNCPKCGMKLVPLRKSATTEETATQTSAPSGKPAKKAKGKILYWRAPMDPTEIYDHPGKSKMGMDLIPVYEGEETLGAGGTITIDPVVVQNIGVRYTEVRRTDFSRVVRTVGMITYDERRVRTVSARISGWVEKLHADFTGQTVRKGAPLLEIYSPDLVTTQQEYLLALRTVRQVAESPFNSIREGASSLLASARKRLLYWNVPESEIERLERTGQVRRTVRLNAPMSGIVLRKFVEEGQHVREGMTLFELADLSRIWVVASIYDDELPWLRTGQKAQVSLPYLPGQSFTGKVDYVYPYLEETSRVVKVRVVLPNPDIELKPGMYADVELHGPVIRDALVVPVEAVIRTGKRNLVFVARGKGKFEPREVKLGEEDGQGRVRVLAGLLEGEKVVTSAQFLLDSESRLQEAIQKMLKERLQTASSHKNSKGSK